MLEVGPVAKANDRAPIDAVLNQYGPDSLQIEDCRAVLSRTAGLKAVTDDNIGIERRHYLGLE